MNLHGIHEAIIDDDTFYTVQDILDGRKKKLPNKFQTVRDEFPLRGYLTCPQCKRTLTASASTGRAGGKFFYYHCSNGCKERHKALDINKNFVGHLQEYNNSPKYMELFAEILKGNLKNCNNTGKKEADKITTSIAKLKMRLKNAKDMMLDGEFSAGDYKAMKIEIEEELEKMNREEMQIRQGIENYDTKIDECLDLLLNLDKYYNAKNTEVKQKIIGSVFPEKLFFKDNEYRTTKLNEAVEILCRTDKGLSKKKEGRKLTFQFLPSEWCPLESNQ